ncbi:beta adaptin [Cryptosporidium ryanae]|uniref:beta adaptin n=1 Tax=Cryptosporidium ryanae TaxID=515981 RepID=UPI00351A24CC|nr:beta adaptin [Cryptosporidium ryanae]
MSDRKYFQSSKRGELQELKEELHSTSKEKKKDAVKKVIAAMTVGKDVSPLFPDVINCMQTGCIEIKKLVYLYIINYAKVQPELAILAVNTFFKDSMDSNPLIRALAIRTMGYIRLEQITEYLVEPLRRSCHDKDPYVRKTAAICISKLYDISPTLMEEQGFFHLLKDMLRDQNAMVVANAVASLMEIYETSLNKGDVLNYLSGKNNVEDDLNKVEDSYSNDNSNFYKIMFSEVEKQQILMALNECSEWGQVYILNSVSEWNIKTEKESEMIIERLTSRLSHANSAVVLSAVRAILNTMRSLNENNNVIPGIIKKLRPCLVTLLTTTSPEIQYVVLRNVQLIIQSNPKFFESEIKIFFCKYNDPVYIKIEKLNLLYRLVNVDTAGTLLKELKEYSTDTNVEFSRNAIRIISLVSIKVRESSSICIKILTELMSNSRQDHIIQEGIISLKDILRSQPNLGSLVVPNLWDISESIVEPESRSSFVWIIGEIYEYSFENNENESISKEDINNMLNNYLQYFVDVFLEELPQVQLQILTTIVKCFLKSPISNQQLVTDIFRLATTNVENPDVRDRAFIYWRLLSTNPEETRKIVLSQKGYISPKSFEIDSTILNRLLRNIGLISSVFHKLPEKFVNYSHNNKEQIKDDDSVCKKNDNSNCIDNNILNINNNDVNSSKIDKKIIFSNESNSTELLNMGELISYSEPTSNAPGAISSNKTWNGDQLLDFGTPKSNCEVNVTGYNFSKNNVNNNNNNNDISNSVDLLSL